MNKYLGLFIRALVVLSLFLVSASPALQDLDPNPPDEVVKLIFIHHSTGENWLTDGYGDLGRSLDQNNYFVSDTNYGWGPDAIGDRTDIPNWIEWFRSEGTPTFMDALLNESGQNSNYTRTLPDPGGENQVILFKSCFPNSELSGRPNDPPGTYEELSVSGAKYVYNELLKYFQTRPDKLFIVITAPPVSAAANAKNARAFNTWLVEDWLAENDYTLNNVAVFDFYNILTDRNAHHRYNNGIIEHIVKAGNTLAYPSGDDHPSEQGSRKATEEFIPMLNIFYHLWAATAPQSPPSQAEQPQPQAEQPQPQVESPPDSATISSLIDDFEGGNPAGTYGWESFRDEATSTTIRCAPDTEMARGGSRSLLVDFNVAANSWATCSLTYEAVQDWSSASGLTFAIRAQQAGFLFDVNLYAGSTEDKQTYIYTIETPPDSTDDWIPFSLNWSDFHRADWEADAGAAFSKPDQVIGLAFGINTFPDTPNTGRYWVDDLSLLEGDSTAVEVAPEDQPEPAQEPTGAEEERPRGISLPCASAAIFPVALIMMGYMRRKQRTR